MDLKKVSVEDAAWIATMTSALEEFRKLNQDVTANQIIVFLLAGLNPGISQREISERIGLADGSVSRICAVLSDRGNRGKAGQGLIEIRQMTEDYRVSGQFLTAKGRRVFDSLRRIMKGR